MEIGDANSHLVFENHDLSVSGQCAADANVDVVAGGPGHAKNAIGGEIENVSDCHHGSVQFDFNDERDVGQMGDAFKGVHGLSLEVDRVLAKLVGGGYDACVCLVTSLQDNEVGEFAGDINS